ncbi:MAG: bifunctional acetate--CoA ligase family protein/GNAT family N-acetyltransferase [Bacteroidales bacterium]|jgi:acetyltransferase|nr:bifunctional acetate--CoA ligase family protein/GNAT family N-acetyltransferase [Bacteroidales bacterium]
MTRNYLDPIFKPDRIAIIGVSINPNSVSGKVLTNLIGSGFKGVIYPVNRTSEAVLGIPCFNSLDSLPRRPDLAVICSAADEVPQWVKECGEAGINGIIIMSAGFRETGNEGLKLENEVKDIRKGFPDMRIIGPNCLGIIIPELKLNLSFAPSLPRKGNIAFISQSGALCTSVLDRAREEKIGFSYFISLGNALDVDFGHLIDYLGADESTKYIILYIESIAGARNFMSAARAFARTKPVIVYKAGRFPESAAVAASHTGALASEDNIYDAAFQRTGITRVYDIGEIFDCAALIGRGKIPSGDRLAIVTNAGGPGVMATDTLIAEGGTLARLGDESMEKLNDSLPPIWSHGNPVDVIGDDRYKRLAKSASIVLEDKNVDALLVILTPQAMTNVAAAARAIGELQAGTKKPILASWLGGEQMKEGIRILNDNNVASYATPEQAVRAFMTLVEYSRNLKILYETPRDISLDFKFDRDEIRKIFSPVLNEKSGTLSEKRSKELLSAYGIEVSMPRLAKSPDEAVKISNYIGYPVVFKIMSPDITHKSDSGGVILDIKNEEQACSAYEQIIENIKNAEPGARFEGITVQPMVKMPGSVEMILGIKRDPVFGTVILAGAGGVTAELFKDNSLGFPPLNERLARRMLEQLRIWPLLKGYRGSKPVDIDKLIEVMIRLSYLAADYPEIKELDINPLLVAPGGLVAVDARIVTETGKDKKGISNYEHLAIVPYPEEYVTEPVKIKDVEIVMRPIKPEDEALWFELLDSCSRESIYSRFNSFFHYSVHEVAARYCYIDYDREIAIVAETEEEGKKKIIGVGRLIADPEHETVEYAILVADKWQNMEIGSHLTDYCLEISKKWGLKKVVAQTNSDNHRIISMFKKRNFSIEHDKETSTIYLEKEIN